jgi:starvation-inducible outer membrane lipoprotein
MKHLLLLTALFMVGCATHPTHVEPVETDIIESCDAVVERINDLNQKQEIAFAGDVVLVSLIGLPLMPSYEDELALELGKLQNCENIW